MKVLIDIDDSDIAAIEAVHDLLIDNHKYSPNYTPLVNVRKVTAKMYESIKIAEKSNHKPTKS